MDKMTSEEERQLKKEVESKINKRFQSFEKQRSDLIVKLIADETDRILKEYIKLALERFGEKDAGAGDPVLINKHFPYFALQFLKTVGKEAMAKNAMKYMIGNPQKPNKDDPFMKKYGDLVQQLQSEFETIKTQSEQLDFISYLEWEIAYIKTGCSSYTYVGEDYPTLCTLDISTWSAESEEIGLAREKIALTLFEEAKEKFR